jgi:hypothetical protein
MDVVISHLLDQPVANLISLGGLCFLFVAVVGKISGKVEPDVRGRVICGLLGMLLLPAGLLIHATQDSPSRVAAAGPTPVKPPFRHRACKAGFVPRLTVPDDRVCVSQQTRDQVAVDNELAPGRTMNGGAYGADTCKPPFVWREAEPGDHICVTAATRNATRTDNAPAANRSDR